MSTDFFRKYLDLLNEASGQPPVDFTPTHFHKNNLGVKIPLMKTPDDKFWWITSDPENPRAGKTIQPWIGNTENRSSGLSGKSSVDGAYQNGEAVDFPEGSTWRDFTEPSTDSAADRSVQTGDPTKKVKEIPHIDPGPLVEPNKKEAPADPPGYRFSNDDALAALAAKLKDAETDGKSSGFDRFNKSGPGDGKLDFRKGFQQDAEASADAAASSDAAASDTTSSDGIGKFFNRSDKFQPSTEADSIASWKANNAGKTAADWGPASISAAGGSPKTRWNIGTQRAERFDPRTGTWVPVEADGKEPIISGDSHCAQCGTPKSLHAPLKHQFVSGDDVRPGSVGGSAPSPDRSTKPASDTIDADQARINKMPSWDRTKNAPVGATPPAPPKSLNAPLKPSWLKEDINQLPVVDQMRAWRQLMEADKPRIAVLPGETAAQAVERAQAELNAPKSTPAAQNTIPGKPKRPALLQPKPTVAGAGRFDSPEEIKARAERARNTSRAPAAVPVEVPVDTTAPARPRIRSVTGDVPVDPNFGRSPPPPPNIPPPAAPPAGPSKLSTKLGKYTPKVLDLAYQIWQGYQQIEDLRKRNLPPDQFNAEAYKIVGRLISDYGVFWAGSGLGAAIGGLFTGGNPLGAVAGFLAGGTGGLAASYYLGDSAGAITDWIVEHYYGTSSTPNAEQIKLNPQQIGELKQYIAEMEAYVAAGNKLDQGQQQDLDKAKAMLKDAGVTVAPTPAPAPTKEGPKEGDKRTSLKGRPMIYTNGRWEYAN